MTDEPYPQPASCWQLKQKTVESDASIRMEFNTRPLNIILTTPLNFLQDF